MAAAWPLEVLHGVLQAPICADPLRIPWYYSQLEVGELLAGTAVQSRAGWVRSFSAAFRLVCTRWKRVHDTLLPCMTLPAILENDSIVLGNSNGVTSAPNDRLYYPVRLLYGEQSTPLFETIATKFPNVTCLELVEVGRKTFDEAHGLNAYGSFDDDVGIRWLLEEDCVDAFLCALGRTPALASRLTDLHVHLDFESDTRTDRLGFERKGCCALKWFPALTTLRLQGGCEDAAGCLAHLGNVTTLTNLDINWFCMQQHRSVRDASVLTLANNLTSLQRLNLRTPICNSESEVESDEDSFSWTSDQSELKSEADELVCGVRQVTNKALKALDPIPCVSIKLYHEAKWREPLTATTRLSRGF